MGPLLNGTSTKGDPYSNLEGPLLKRQWYPGLRNPGHLLKLYDASSLPAKGLGVWKPCGYTRRYGGRDAGALGISYLLS